MLELIASLRHNVKAASAEPWLLYAQVRLSHASYLLLLARANGIQRISMASTGAASHFYKHKLFTV